MRERRFYGVVQLDVGELLPADDFLLSLDRQGVPLGEVVKVFLYDHIAAAGEGGVFLADQRGVDRGPLHGVFRAVDETKQVAVVEVFEALHLVGRKHGVAKPRHDARRHLEAQVHARGADMEQQVARRGDGVMHAADFAKGVQLSRFRRSEQAVPRVGADPHDAGESAIGRAKADAPHQRGEIAAQAARRSLGFRPGAQSDDQKNGGARQPGVDGLW